MWYYYVYNARAGRTQCKLVNMLSSSFLSSTYFITSKNNLVYQNTKMTTVLVTPLRGYKKIQKSCGGLRDTP